MAGRAIDKVYPGKHKQHLMPSEAGLLHGCSKKEENLLLLKLEMGLQPF